MKFNWDKKIDEYLNKAKNGVSLYMNEESTIKNITELAEEFDLDYDEVEKLYVYEMEDGKLVSEASTTGNIAGLFLAPGLWFLWRSLSGLFSKASKKCGVYSISDERDVCLHQAKIKILAKKIDIIKKAAAECVDKAGDDSEKRSSCKQKEKDAIEKVKEQIDTHNEKIAKIKKERNLE